MISHNGRKTVTDIHLGLLINFGEALLKDGVKQIAN